MYRLEIEGKPPSSNKYYAGVHYRIRKDDADLWHTLFLNALKGHKTLPKPLKTPITINTTLFSKRPYDSDNVSLTNKFFQDSLVSGGWIKDDDYKTIPTVILNSRKGDKDKIVILIT